MGRKNRKKPAPTSKPLKPAINLAPKSIEFAHFYAKLLHENASEYKDYDVVVCECTRALTIEDPVYPAHERFKEATNLLDGSSKQHRIKNFRLEIQSFLDKTKLAMCSNLMSSLGVLNEMPNKELKIGTKTKLKIGTKTYEERRREIEASVAAARFSKQNSEFQSGNKTRERMKIGNAMKKSTSVEIGDQAKSYWNKMTPDKQKEFLMISVSDLLSHFRLSDVEVIEDAVSFWETHEKWKMWICYRCRFKKFNNVNSFTEHLAKGF